MAKALQEYAEQAKRWTETLKQYQQQLDHYQQQLIKLQRLNLGVSADVKLTHSAEVKVTHLGHDGGLLKAADVDSGAGSGDTCDG
ncbi:hypothetical protein AB5N79_23400, partial [Xanthomonas citri pv. citri]